MVDAANGSASDHPLSLNQGAWEIKFSPDGQWAFVTNEFLPPPGLASSAISVLATSNHSEMLTVPVGRCPIDLAVLGNGRYVYVTNWGDNTVSVVDTATFQAVATVNVTVRPSLTLRVAPLSLVTPLTLKVLPDPLNVQVV